MATQQIPQQQAQQYRVIYLWQQERHAHSLTFEQRPDASTLALQMRSDGWVAWVERSGVEA